MADLSDSWLSNSEAVANVKRLLLQTGTPLESRVARVCADSSVWSQHTHFDNLVISSGRILYGDSSTDTAVREVDCGITMQSEIDVGNAEAGNDEFELLPCELQVLIECKHREGLAVFGFPYQTQSERTATNPLVCEFAFADFIKKANKQNPFLPQDNICTIGLLDNIQKSPRVLDEQLIYKAGASLYDCIRFNCRHLSETAIDPVIKKLGLLERFKEETGKLRANRWMREALAWMNTGLTEATYADFYASSIESRGGYLFPELTAFVPVICVDAPLYLTKVDSQGNIEEIYPRDYLLTALRLPKWPGALRPYLVHSTPEALVTIVTVDYLESFLAQVAQWFSSIAAFLEDRDDIDLRKIIVQSAFLQSLWSLSDYPRSSGGLWHV